MRVGRILSQNYGPLIGRGTNRLAIGRLGQRDEFLSDRRMQGIFDITQAPGDFRTIERAMVIDNFDEDFAFARNRPEIERARERRDRVQAFGAESSVACNAERAEALRTFFAGEAAAGGSL